MGKNGWLVGDGEIVELIRSKDWSRTALGPIDEWPESLQTTVSLSLASSFPINVIWGPGAVQIWNEAYSKVCGDKHPREFASDYRECWASATNPSSESARRSPRRRPASRSCPHVTPVDRDLTETNAKAPRRSRAPRKWWVAGLRGSGIVQDVRELTTTTSRTRGPCTPSTRSSSMSEVADGPETNVIGCSAAPARRPT